MNDESGKDRAVQSRGGDLLLIKDEGEMNVSAISYQVPFPVFE
jgi:hypothetical protein